MRLDTDSHTADRRYTDSEWKQQYRPGVSANGRYGNYVPTSDRISTEDKGVDYRRSELSTVGTPTIKPTIILPTWGKYRRSVRDYIADLG